MHPPDSRRAARPHGRRGAADRLAALRREAAASSDSGLARTASMGSSLSDDEDGNQAQHDPDRGEDGHESSFGVALAGGIYDPSTEPADWVGADGGGGWEPYDAAITGYDQKGGRKKKKTKRKKSKVKKSKRRTRKKKSKKRTYRR